MEWQILLLGIIIGYCLRSVIREIVKRVAFKKAWKAKATKPSEESVASIAYYQGGEIVKVPYEGDGDDWPK